MKKLSVVLIALLVLSSLSTLTQAVTKEDLRETVLDYMAQPEFSGKGFLYKLTGTRAKFEFVDPKDQAIYFSIKADEYTEDLPEKLCENPDRIEFGETQRTGKFKIDENDSEFIALGNWRYGKPNMYFFRIPLDNLKVDSPQRISYPFWPSSYDITLGELHSFRINKTLYGVYREVKEKDTGHTFTDHGAWVAVKGEASLQRLAKSIIGGAATREQKAQELLDFVSSEIYYSPEEANAKSEIMKRPSEVLMTGESDCSGKAILLASLLEQTETDIDYLMVWRGDKGEEYYHLTIGIEWNPASANGHCFRWMGKSYSIAETTMPYFQIGKSRISNPEKILYIQRPGWDSYVYDFRTGEPLEFFNQ